MNIGLTNEKKCIVTKELTAQSMGSGDLPVFATPAMIALMEGCAAESVAGLLEEGTTTVGTHIDVQHLSATPIGMEVVCKIVLKKAEGRSLHFTLEAWDESGLIGKGEHDRFIVYSKPFKEKTYQKLEK
ncbi:MAG: thioesterase family protein [Clostridia bacterium]|nr:thioesterase family protein [Clostridia bacterium]